MHLREGVGKVSQPRWFGYIQCRTDNIQYSLYAGWRLWQWYCPFIVTGEEDGTMSFGGRNDNGTVREIEAAAAPPCDRQA